VTAPVATVHESEQSDYWEEEGRRVAASLGGLAAAVVVGANPDLAARVAVGIARATCRRRHVALGDLVGDLAPLYAVAGGADAFGLSDCFRDGNPLNDVARPAPDCDTLFILPAGTPPVATYDVLAHDRWPRLIRGFGEAGALLLLVAPLDAPGVDVLVAAAGGVIAVDTPPQRVARYHVLATVGKPAVAGAAVAGRRPRSATLVAAGVALLAVLAIAGWLALRNRASGGNGADRPAPTSVAPTRIIDPSGVAPGVTSRTDTVRLGAVVNPGDSAKAAAFAVELVAANSVAGANSVLQESEDATAMADRRTAAVVPVELGGGSLWFKAVVGAWHDRASADSLLDAVRARGIVRRDAGVVVRVPYALLLGVGVARSRADIVVNSWRSRGIAAYGLLQDDGSVRVYAGAFETPAQAAPLAASVRDAGEPPVVAIRTGRSF
jgi:hypothetical protein